MEGLALFLQTAVQMGTPLLFGTLGGIFAEKAGHLNLGIEGMMLMGAAFGFSCGIQTGNPWLSILAAGLAGAFGALIYAVITVTLRGNQTVTGLALTIFGTGLANFIGKGLSGLALEESVTGPLAVFDFPGLSQIPFLGTIFFKQSVYVYFAIILAVLMYFYLKKTRMGLSLRIVGENPYAADASGINISLYKYLHVVLGGFLCGLGGGYLSLVFVPRWQDNLTAGQGWIAVALVIFATWTPLKAIFGAYFFGALRGLGFKLQNLSFTLFGLKISVASQFLDMLPYLITVLMLVFIMSRNKKENQPPKWLSLPYFREDR